MKRNLFYIFVLLLLITQNISAEVTGDVTGGAITGEATTHDISLGIVVIAMVPDLSIINPENKTYITGNNIALNYSALRADNLWYHINDKQNNTINSSIYFTVQDGAHILYLYANNSAGVSSKNISFTANSSLLTIIYDEYKGLTKGESTDFEKHPYEKLQNMSNVILEDTFYGKIKFNEIINLTDDEDFNDNEVDIDSNINISLNRIKINSTALPNFNKSATLSLYNIAFTNPRILKDGVVCPSTICTQQSYSNNILVFNVTGFSIYSAEETPVEVIITVPGTGGGGGGTTTTTIIEKFEVIPEEFLISLKQGETTTKEIIIKNTGKEIIKINIENPKLEQFIKISETSFELKPDEEKTIILDFIARQDTLPNLYIGNLIIKSDTTEKSILIAIEVESDKALFDIKAEIPKKYKIILPGEELLAVLKLYNLGGKERIDVLIDYIIKDEAGNEILFEQETIAVEIQASFIKTFTMPEDIKFGKYVLYTKVTYNGEVASASAWFSIGKKPFFDLNKIIIIVVIIILINLAILLMALKKSRKNKKFRGYKRKK